MPLPALEDKPFDSLNLGLLLTEQGVITNCNVFFTDLVGLDHPGCIGMTLQDFLTDESREVFENTVETNSDTFGITLQLVSSAGEKPWVRLNYKFNKAYPSGVDLFSIENITAAQLKELIFGRLMNGFTNNDDLSIFSSVVTTLTQVFGVKYSFIGVYDSENESVDVRAISVDGVLEERFSYPLEHTPCKDVLTLNCVIINEGAYAKYPLDEDLKNWKVEGYIGVTLNDQEGKSIGHIALMDTRPIDNEEFIVSILEMYSSRLAMELEKEARERAIESSESKYRSLFDHAFEAKMVYDPSVDRYLEVNKAACELFGYSREELLTLNPQKLKPAKLGEVFVKDNIRHATLEVLSGGTYTEETLNQKADGMVFETELAVSLLDKEKQHILVSLRDIGKRKEAERELDRYKNHLEGLVRERTHEIEMLNDELVNTNGHLENSNTGLLQQKEELAKTLQNLKLAQEQLILSEKMASLGILTSGIAHEMNNSLNLIGGGMNLIKLETGYLQDIPEEIDEELKNGLEWISDGIDRAAKIVRGLATYGQHGSGQRIAISVDEIVRNISNLYQSGVKEQIEIKTSLNISKEILAYPSRLQVAFSNIIDNAVYFTKKGEGCSVQKQIEITSQESKDKSSITVIFRNYGEQIPEEARTKIFDPFFTTKDTGEGTGLGLTVAYSFIEQHDGTIKPFNHEDGVSFIVTLPIA